jgi:hypothetical protein
MMQAQDKKTICNSPATVTAGGTGTMIVDTRGFSEAQFVIAPSAGTGATNNPTVLKIEHGDSTSAFGNLTGYVGGTNSDGGFTIPSAIATAATAVQPYVLNVDLRGKKRFLRLSISPQTTITYGFACNLSRPAQSPNVIGEAVNGLGTDGAHVAGSTTLGLVVNPQGQLGA